MADRSRRLEPNAAMKHLEPVVKKNISYSILFLRDDSSVVRFRLKPYWIKFLAVVFILFSGTSGAAGYAAHYYWKRYNILKYENSGLEVKLEEGNRKLAAYTGVAMLNDSITLPRSSMVGVSVLASSGKVDGAQNAADGQSEPGSGNGDTSVQIDGNAPQATTAPQMPETGQPGALESVAYGDSGTVNGESPIPLQPEQTNPPAGTAGKEHPALISEVLLRSEGGKSFTLAFDLSNRDQQLTLNGRVEVAIITKSGPRHEITQVNRNALRFIINRYKRVNTHFVLPGDIQPEDIAKLLLTVAAEDQPAITYTFPFLSPS